jgi:hypothetical protein
VTPERIVLNGYACPFGTPAVIGDRLEQFEAGAFSALLSKSPTIDLRWESHEPEAPQLASTADGSLTFFEDETGLGFEARLDMSDFWNWSRVRSITQKKNPMSLVSVGGLFISSSRRETLNIGQVTVVTAASIDHITICKDAAYRSTAVWPTHLPIEDAPWKIQNLASQWTEGRGAWDRKRSARQPAEAAASQGLRAIGRTISGHFVMMAPNGRLSVRWAK